VSHAKRLAQRASNTCCSRIFLTLVYLLQNPIHSTGTDLTFVTKVHTQLNGHSHLVRPRFLPDAFIVKHYAQDVTYVGAGFLDKNRDTISGASNAPQSLR